MKLWNGRLAEITHGKTQKKLHPRTTNRGEIVVNAYGPEERAMGWYYYLEDKIHFPFRARCTASKVVSPLKKGETVEVLQLAPEEACTGDMLVLIRWGERKVAGPVVPAERDRRKRIYRPSNRRLAVLGSARLPPLNLAAPDYQLPALPKGHKHALSTRPPI